MNKRLSLLYLLLALPMAACDDNFGPQDWTANPDTVVLFSLSRPEYINEPSAFVFYGAVPLPIESPISTGRWDVALIEQGGQLAFAPAGAFQGQTSRAAIAPMPGTTLEELERAPGDNAFADTAVVLNTGVVYAVRTNRSSCGLGTGVRYGKFEVLELNQAEGKVRFRTITNPYCNDRRLIPPD